MAGQQTALAVSAERTGELVMAIDQLESAEREGSHMQAKVLTIGNAPGYRDMELTVEILENGKLRRIKLCFQC